MINVLSEEEETSEGDGVEWPIELFSVSLEAGSLKILSLDKGGLKESILLCGILAERGYRIYTFDPKGVQYQ
jgi:hypothetical protein